MGSYDYEQRVFGQQDIRWADYRLQRFVRHLGEPEGRVFVDIGCGAGARTALISRAKPGLTCIGIEFTERSLETGMQAHAGQVQFVRATAERLPLEDGIADYVAGFDIFEHLERPEQALADCYRILKPGGVFHGFIPCEGEPLSLYRWVPKLQALKRRNVGHIQHFTKRQMRGTLKGLGYDIMDEGYSYSYISQVGDLFRQVSKLTGAQATHSGINLAQVRSKPLAALIRLYRWGTGLASDIDLVLSRVMPPCSAGYHVTARKAA